MTPNQKPVNSYRKIRLSVSAIQKPDSSPKIKTIAVAAILLVCFAVVGLHSKAAYGNNETLAILPFKINAQSDYAFLQEGVLDMLYSRLSDRSGFDLIRRDRTEAQVQQAGPPSSIFESIEIGGRLNAGFVLYGSLTVLGESVGIDAEMSSVEQKRPPLRFIERCETLDDVIPAVGRFADQIIGHFARDLQPPAVSGEQEKPRKQPGERIDKAETPDETGKAKTPESSRTVDFVVPEDDDMISGFNKLLEVNKIVTCVATADINGDGADELIITDEERIYEARSAGGALEHLEQIHRIRYKNIIGLDAADMNGNNIDELYVTCLNSHRTAVESMILEAEGGRMTVIADSAPFYLKIGHLSPDSPELLGQSYTPNQPYAGEISVLELRGNELASTKPIMRANGHNLVGMAVYHAPNGPLPLIAAYNEKQYLEILNMTNGAGLWKSQDVYGGSMAYHLLPKTERGSENRKYLQAPLRAADLNLDGSNELLVVKNYEISKGLLRDFRKFSHFQFCAFTWKNGRLEEIWKTVKSPGYINDYRIGDFDNDGQDELIAAIVQKEGANFFLKPLTAIVAQELPFGPSTAGN